jgi:hypothetical protein
MPVDHNRDWWQYGCAARLMRRLADVLSVPYLFHADAAGWQQEEARAKTRPPLSSGCIVS